MDNNNSKLLLSAYYMLDIVIEALGVLTHQSFQ